jgi:hypothetical protein
MTCYRCRGLFIVVLLSDDSALVLVIITSPT